MPDHRLKALTPLGLDAPRSDIVGGIAISEDVSRALASVAARSGREAELAAAMRSLLALPLPEPGKSVENDRVRVIWTGPEQYFVEAPFETHEDIARILKNGLGDTASVTEQTDAWARFLLAGPRLGAMLERLVPIDLHRMAAGDATRTVMEHLSAFVLCHEPMARYTILGARSSAGSLHHALVTAARSVA